MLLVMGTSPPVCVKHGCLKVRKKNGKNPDGSQMWKWRCRECFKEEQARHRRKAGVPKRWQEGDPPPVCEKHGCEKVRRKAGKKADGSQQWQWRCQECVIESQRARRGSTARWREGDPPPVCAKHGCEKVRRKAGKNLDGSQKWEWYCRECSAGANRRHNKKNPEARREEYRRRRARKRRATVEKITPCDLALILVQQTWACAYCGADLLTTPKHLDHIIPLSRGGAHTLDNLIYACEACNLSKNAALPGEWRSAAVFLLVEEDVVILAA